MMNTFVLRYRYPILIFVITLIAYLIVIEINMLRYEQTLKNYPNATHLLIVYGDEPFYLAIVSTIVFNHSIYLEQHFLGPDLDPNINKSKWPESFQDTHTWRAVDRGDGHYITLHGTGLPYLLVPGYALDGIKGAMITMAIATSFISVFIYNFVSRFTSTKTSIITTLIFSLSTLLLTYSNQIYPDVIISLFLIIPLYFIFFKNNSKYYMSYAGAMLGFGVFFKLSFLTIDVVLLPLVFLMTIRKKIPVKIFIFFIGFFLLMTFFAGLNNLYSWGTWKGSPVNPEAFVQSGGYFGFDNSKYYFDVLIEEFFGKDHGLFIFSPVVMISVLGIGSLFFKNRLLAITILAVSCSLIIGYLYAIATLALLGDDPPFRYEMPLLPLMALPFALALERFSNKLSFKLLLFLLLIASIAFCLAFAENRFYSLDHFPSKMEVIHIIYQGLEFLFPVLGPADFGGQHFPHHPLDSGNEIFLIGMMSLLISGIIISFKKEKSKKV